MKRSKIDSKKTCFGLNYNRNYRLKGALLALLAMLLLAPASGGRVSVASGDGNVYPLETPSIDLLSPNGGESLAADSNYSIRWESSDGISNVCIEYATCGESPDWIAVDPCVGNTGSYDWIIPQVISVRCLVRIRDDNSGVFDTSEGEFTIFECQKALLADLNNNCYVDWSDLAIITDNWLAGDCCDPNWCEGADLDKDEDVDLIDLSIFASRWPECGNSVDPACGCAPVVPNVLGMPEPCATASITAIDNLTVGAVMYKFSTVPAGLVISQSPPGGTTVPIGSSVYLEVSVGLP